MPTCISTGCDRPVHNKKRSLCKRCYAYRHRRHRRSDPCAVDGCQLHAAAHGFCAGHYNRWRRYGDPLLRREDGRWEDEHRIVVRRVPGRDLLPGESVHHRNGDKLDNSPENLELWVRRQPTGQRVEDLVARAREILDRYGYLVDEQAHDRLL